ncbi:hypothetical protein CGLO_12836 [Colletotrichum gloeosporioides Cg-14]|uniref:Uncharacterized protein n=1 Tax=Colletotrichum gloeosporioides (strain Cg-14) TaxID=1237896 RepID=T0K4U5_COLGC|nr:hypothetical protein CGLO_12836 [Colletotrichum gloeosporioides Cg-14]
MMKIIDDWETSREEMDWYSFQQEYRDYIDLLGEVARHVFHLRILKEMK